MSSTRLRIDVAGLCDPSRASTTTPRRRLIDVRKLLEPTSTIRPSQPVRKISDRAAAFAVADAAMIMAIGRSPEAVRRCATTVAAALDTLDATTADDFEPAMRAAAIEVIFARCTECGRCAAR